MAEALLASDVLFLLVFKLARLQFETRKDVVTIFSFMCKHVPGPSLGNGLSRKAGVGGLNGAHRRSAHDLVSLSTMSTPNTSPGLTYVLETPRMLETLCGCATALHCHGRNSRGDQDSVCCAQTNSNSKTQSSGVHCVSARIDRIGILLCHCQPAVLVILWLLAVSDCIH